MKFEYIHHIINEDGNRIEWWAVNDCDMIVLPYDGNTPLFSKARFVNTDGNSDFFDRLAATIRLEEHMINQYKQHEHEDRQNY